MLLKDLYRLLRTIYIIKENKMLLKTKYYRTIIEAIERELGIRW